MSLIDASYFRGEINIAQLSQVTVQENLQYFIDKYERDLLDKLLGYSLAKSFLDGLAIEPIEQKWIDLRDGLVYNIDLDEHRWIGLVNDQKQSIIANYVYYHYTIDHIDHTVGIGNVRPKAENATVVSPAYKLERAWNEMSDWIKLFRCYMENHTTAYPTWKMRNDDCYYFKKINRFNL